MSILTPAQVGQYIKGFMDRDRLLSNLLVRGELSNCRLYPSGHHYFTLKDGEGALRCVMFRGDAASLRFQPENGMQVIAAGRVTVFPRDGQYQLYCTRLVPEGAGDLHTAFEQLKRRLLEEGLFDQSRKKPLPPFPGTIALVTSPAGAAVRDMLRILKSRWPMTRVRVLPVRVQGEGAAQEIASAIRWANRYRVADLIITGRGGGSMEDLWAFNEEVVARAIAASELPVISAVGHEPDVTIADFAADLRAATPSNAAELAVPDQREVRAGLEQIQARLEHAMGRRLAGYRQALDRLSRSRSMTEPAAYFQNKRLLLDYHSRRLSHGGERCLSGQRERLGRLASALDAMSPLKVLGRGYAIPRREDGRVLTSAGDAAAGDRLLLRLSDGTLRCRVEAREI
ncbi:MAG: exodeoxyribonuclease VII large subunit [Lawsonibacter sp.]|nr:exodeoxyribonuclease VII large subunit [Lawsonibacter sp.]